MAEPDDEPRDPDDPSSGPADEPAHLQVTGAPDGAGAKAAAPVCNAAFRKKLLSRLWMLDYQPWKVDDSFQLDDEWSAIVSMNADSLLEPIEKVVATRPDPMPAPPPRSSQP
jgi:hypothetical protein